MPEQSLFRRAAAIEERSSGPGLSLEEATVFTLESFHRPDGSSLGPGFISMGRTAIVLQEDEKLRKSVIIISSDCYFNTAGTGGI
jgi:hypothetical protein